MADQADQKISPSNSPQGSVLQLSNVLFISSQLEADGKQSEASPSTNEKIDLGSVNYVNVGGEPYRVTAQGITPVGVESQLDNHEESLDQANALEISYDYVVAHFAENSSGLLPYNQDIQVIQNSDFPDGFLVPLDCIELDPIDNNAVVVEPFETVLPYATLKHGDGTTTGFADAPVWVDKGTVLALAA